PMRARRMVFTGIALALLTTGLSNQAFGQVGPNDVALGKSASQSTTYGGWATADRAVDGIVGPGLAFTSITESGEQFGWWMVDLGGDFDISSIILWNRGD